MNKRQWRLIAKSLARKLEEETEYRMSMATLQDNVRNIDSHTIEAMQEENAALKQENETIKRNYESLIGRLEVKPWSEEARLLKGFFFIRLSYSDGFIPAKWHAGGLIILTIDGSHRELDRKEFKELADYAIPKFGPWVERE